MFNRSDKWTVTVDSIRKRHFTQLLTFFVSLILSLVSDECGIVAQISQPLADSDISAYYISTFSFDHALVSFFSSSSHFFFYFSFNYVVIYLQMKAGVMQINLFWYCIKTCSVLIKVFQCIIIYVAFWFHNVNCVHLTAC